MPPDPPSAHALRACNANATPTWAIILYLTTQTFVATALGSPIFNQVHEQCAL